MIIVKSAYYGALDNQASDEMNNIFIEFITFTDWSLGSL